MMALPASSMRQLRQVLPRVDSRNSEADCPGEASSATNKVQ
jgi:hypothetical protein